MREAAPQVSVAEVPPRLPARKTERRVWLAIWMTVALGCCAILFFFNPAQHGFYPRCAFYQLTGWQCPGCGGLRAAHQLLHGRVLAALQLNALAVASGPLLLWWLWRERVRGGVRLRSRWVWLFVAVLLIFGVVRNLPGFRWLAP